MPADPRVQAVRQDGILWDLILTQDRKALHLWGRRGPGAELELTRRALEAPGLPVFLGSGLGAGIAWALDQGRKPLAVVDREAALLAASGCRERFGGHPDVLWLDEADPESVLTRLRSWQAAHGGAPLLPVAVPLYLRLDRPYYEALRQAQTSPSPSAAGNLFARLAHPRFQEDLPRVLVLGARYFIMGEVLNALERLGAPFRLLDLHRDCTSGAAYCASLLTAAAEFRPDFVLAVNHLGFDHGGTLTGLLEKLRLPAASWFVDNPDQTLFLFRDAASPWVLVCCHDADDAQRLRSKGFPHVLHLPLGTDQTIFRPQAVSRPGWDFDVSFVGDSKAVLVGERLKVGRFPRPLLLAYRRVAETFLANPEGDVRRHLETRHPEVIAQVQALPEAERRKWYEGLILREASRLYRLSCVEQLLPFSPAIAGDRHWERALRRHRGWVRLGRLDYFEDLPGLYRATKVNFNCTSAQMKGAPNQRVFDVPACGSFLLTDERRQIADLFEPGREVVFFREPGEIKDLLRFYLDHETERERVARAAQARVLAEHTYEHRLRTLFAAMRRAFA